MARHELFFAVIAVHVANTASSWWVGYLSPDSWAYLRLAEGVWLSGYPSIDGAYQSLYASGYPMLIAAACPGCGLYSAILASKIVNAVLWSATFVVLALGGIPSVLAGALVCSPLALRLGAYTWSESTMMFCFALCLYGMARAKPQDRRFDGLVLIGSLIGPIARYMFGFMLPGLGVAYILGFRRRAQGAVVASLLAGFACFLGYLVLNWFTTGTTTGPRLPAPEQSEYLLSTFLSGNQLAIELTIVPLALVTAAFAVAWRPTALSVSALVLGMFYIGLLGYLRANYQFDLYTWRLLGPGWMLIGIGIAAGVTGIRSWPNAEVAILIGLGLYSLYDVHAENLRAVSASGQLQTSAVSAVQNYSKRWTLDADVRSVVVIDNPSPRPTVNGLYAPYYPSKTVLSPGRAPYERRESFEEFVARVRAAGVDHCVIDFRGIPNRAALDAILNREFRTASTATERVFALSAADHFRAVFEPLAIVPCRKLVEN